MANNASEQSGDGSIERVLKIKRCAAVVKGGRRFSFAALVVVGDGKGKVGFGYGKANEVPPSVQKAQKQANRDTVEVPLVEGTIPGKGSPSCNFCQHHARMPWAHPTKPANGDIAAPTLCFF